MMRWWKGAGAAVVVSLLVALLAAAPARAEARRQPDAGKIVVANRGSADLSVIDAATHEVRTVELDGSEPMYVNHWRPGDKVFVGDRANDQVVVLDDETFEVLDRIDVGAGVFHQWVDTSGHQLWVVGDVDNTVTVIDPRSHDVLATIPLPTDITSAGGRPHDVFVTARAAFVSVVGLEQGIVLRYDTRTFEPTHRAEVAADPHLFVRAGRLYVPQQDGSVVSVLRPRDLTPLGEADVPSAHGVWVTRNGRVLTTNIAGGGTDGVVLLDRTLRRQLDIVDTSVPTPHNVTVDRHERQAFVTHSGAMADQVSIIGLTRTGFGDSVTVQVGTNPFGLGLVR